MTYLYRVGLYKRDKCNVDKARKLTLVMLTFQNLSTTLSYIVHRYHLIMESSQKFSPSIKEGSYLIVL